MEILSTTTHYELVDNEGRTVGGVKHGTQRDAAVLGLELVRTVRGLGTISVALVTEQTVRSIERVRAI